MGDTQNQTIGNQSNGGDTAETSIIDPNELLQLKQQSWIDYCAVGGLLTDDDGTLQPMTIGEFSIKLGVARATLYDWKKRIPDFEERVKAARIRIGGGSRLRKVHNGLYLRASQGVPDAVKLYLQIFDGWQPPAQKHDVEVTTGLADLIAQKKLEQERTTKVIDATTADDTTSHA